MRIFRLLRKATREVIVNAVAGSFLCPRAVRAVLYRVAGLSGVSLGARVWPQVVFRSSSITIGSASTIGYRCLFDNRGGVFIGDRCGIGADVLFVTSDHDHGDPTRRAGVGRLAPIRLGDGVWIGSRATILGGVSVGDGSVVAAGSVVTTDVPPHALVAGVPAKIIRQLPTT